MHRPRREAAERGARTKRSHMLTCGLIKPETDWTCAYTTQFAKGLNTKP